jgi:hypothetical protein
MALEGLLYVSSWVDENLQGCYRLMETDDRRLLDQWMAKWNDLVDFEVHPVITSKEAADNIGPRLQLMSSSARIRAIQFGLSSFAEMVLL